MRAIVKDPKSAEIKARIVLFMAWDYTGTGRTSNASIAKDHYEIAKELKLEVAPVALAWQRILDERPDFGLWAGDGIHPNARRDIFGRLRNLCHAHAREPSWARVSGRRRGRGRDVSAGYRVEERDGGERKVAIRAPLSMHAVIEADENLAHPSQ